MFKSKSKTKGFIKAEAETLLGSRQFTSTQGYFKSILFSLKPKPLSLKDFQKEKDFALFDEVMDKVTEEERTNMYRKSVWQSYLGFFFAFLTILFSVGEHGMALLPYVTFTLFFSALWLKGSYGCYFLNNRHFGGLTALLKSPLEYFPNPTYEKGDQS